MGMGVPWRSREARCGKVWRSFRERPEPTTPAKAADCGLHVLGILRDRKKSRIPFSTQLRAISRLTKTALERLTGIKEDVKDEHQVYADQETVQYHRCYGSDGYVSCWLCRRFPYNARKRRGNRCSQWCGSGRVDRLCRPSSCFRRGYRRGTWSGRRCLNRRSVARA
jgi:hypothetical protein